jgi:uncharacterized protein with PIN domain
MNLQTKLIKKVAGNSKVCISCDTQITKGEVYHLEEGVSEHIHSLLARSFCSKCYAKYGEKKLLKENK